MVQAYTIRALLLAAMWICLTGGEASSWLWGGPVIALVAAWRLREAPPSHLRLRPWGLIRFVPFFLWRSLVGGCDVAWRVLHWRLPITPTIHEYEFQFLSAQPSGVASPARVLFANVVNLCPGTLVAAWHGDRLLIHLLTSGPDGIETLRHLERQVAMLFGPASSNAEEVVA